MSVQWEKTLKDEATTSDVLNAIVATVRAYCRSSFALAAVKHIKEYCQQTGCTSSEDFIKALYEWACRNLDYKLDPEGNEIIRTPDLSVRLQNADCKKFSILLGSILCAAGYEPIFKHVFYEGNDNYSHIYIILPNPDLQNYITLDCTLDVYDKEVKYKSYCLYLLNGQKMPSNGYKLTMMGKANTTGWASDIGCAADNVLNTAKTVGRGIGDSSSSGTGTDVTAIARGMFLSAIHNNINGIATQMLAALSKNPNAINDIWQKYGGAPADIKELVLLGSQLPPTYVPGGATIGNIDTQYSRVGAGITPTPTQQLYNMYMLLWQKGQGPGGWYGWPMGSSSAASLVAPGIAGINTITYSQASDTTFRTAWGTLLKAGYKVPMPHGKGQSPKDATITSANLKVSGNIHTLHRGKGTGAAIVWDAPAHPRPHKPVRGSSSAPSYTPASYTTSGGKMTFVTPWGSYTDTPAAVLYWVAQGPGTTQALNTWIQGLDSAVYGGDIQVMEDNNPQRNSNPDQMVAFINGIINRIGSPATQNNKWIQTAVSAVITAGASALGIPPSVSSAVVNAVTNAVTGGSSSSTPTPLPTNTTPGNSNNPGPTGTTHGSLAGSPGGWLFKCIFLGIVLPNIIHSIPSNLIGTILLGIGLIGASIIYKFKIKPNGQRNRFKH